MKVRQWAMWVARKRLCPTEEPSPHGMKVSIILKDSKENTVAGSKNVKKR